AFREGAARFTAGAVRHGRCDHCAGGGAMTDPATLFHRLYDRTPIGVEEDLLERAEQRLGLLLPPPLRALHLACGREASVMSAHNRFLSPGALDHADVRLIFCEENQTVCVWGCVP